MKRIYVLFIATAIFVSTVGCVNGHDIYIVDKNAKFYDSSLKTIDLKRYPICNSSDVAAQMAEIVFVKAYGEKVLKERPWHVTDMGDSYAVTGSLEEGFLGGVAQLKIMKENGAIVLYLHGK